jgi:hypothetical protein
MAVFHEVPHHNIVCCVPDPNLTPTTPSLLHFTILTAVSGLLDHEVPRHVISQTVFGPYIFLGTLYPNTCNLYIRIKVRTRVTQQHSLAI